MTSTNNRKVLIPLATLLAAGAVAIGSGATFSSESGSAISATSGRLVHVNNQDQATLTIDNLKPGASETGTLTITNDGSLDSTLKVVADDLSGTLGEKLQLKIVSSQTGTAYDDNFEDAVVNTAGYDLGALDADKVDVDGDPVDDVITVTITVRMEGDADNTWQETLAGLDLTFVTTQTVADADEDDAEGDSGWVGPPTPPVTP